MRTCRSLIRCVPLIVGLVSSLHAQEPDIGDPPAAPQLRPLLLKRLAGNAPAFAAPAAAGWYDTSTRTAVRDAWNLAFWPTITVPTGWTGNVDSNIPGTTAQAFKDAVAARINWFRAMAGVPPQIAISPVYSAKDQQAALMFSANRQISHYPPSTWVDYSAEGAEAAANSNICYGYSNDPGCVAAYIGDSGSNNAEAGHRRWILYPQTLTMGSGDVPQSGPAANPYPPANALWVFDGLYGTARPATRAAYVAWPPPGFVPYQVVAPRWSFSYPGADFTNASVSMQRNGAAVPVRQEQVVTGYGENTIVWVPDNLDASAYFQPTAPAVDTTSTVTLTNVLISGAPQTFSYSVTVFDPDTAPGSSFQFQPPSASIGSGGSSGASSLVVIPASTTWTAVSSAAWLTLTSAASGTGSTSTSWSATANSSSYQRTATIRGGTATFTVVQDGAPCSYAFSAYSGTLPATGGSGSFTITSTPSDCPFGSYSWNGTISVTSSWAGTGVLTVNYSAGVNNTGSVRSSTIQIAGSSFSVTQSSGQQASLAIAKTHAGNFTQGQTGATYSVTVSNGAGAGSTSGTVTVTETVPAGMTLVSMSGTGWTCPGTAANNCTRSDALNGGTSYPAITVTVNVAENATSPQVNSVSVSGGGSATANITDSTVISPPVALRFVPITPCRVADTRKATGSFGGPSISGGSSRDFTVPNSTCSITPTAQAYSVNVAVVPSGPLGYLTLWPAGQTMPVASTLNSVDGRTKSNAAIVPAGTAGAVSVFASNTTDVVLDINGYFVAATDPTALAFYPVTPCRVADTRKAALGLLGTPSMGAGQSRTFPVQSSACNIPATAQAYSLNFTAVPGGPLGYLTTWPTGQTMPVASSLNAVTGTVTANAAIVPAGSGGSIDVFASNTTDLVIDINGYFAPMGMGVGIGGLSLYTATPCRVVDTRKPAGSPPITSLDVAVTASPCGIPSSAQAYVLSVTVVPPGPLGYLTLWPQGQTRPTVSTLNAVDGAITSNLAIVPTTNGSISAFASNLTHLILDISGYFGQ